MLCQFYTKLYIFLRLAEYFRTYTYSILCNNFNSWKKLVYTFLNPSMPYISNMQHSAKISILFREGIIKIISYERCAYKSVDDKSPSWDTSRKTTKKIMHLRVNLVNHFLKLRKRLGKLLKILMNPNDIL